jgi:hypothetical protein
MSRQLALDILALRPVSRFARAEYSLEYQLPAGQERDPARRRQLYDAWNLDFLWTVQDGLRGEWERFGRSTDMGHAGYAQNDRDLRQSKPSPFASVEDVWAFDAVAEYGLPTMEAQVAAYEAWLAETRVQFPQQLCPGGYYKTIISGAIQSFGWDLLLEAAADVARMERVFDSFFRRTLFHMEAWAQTSAEAIIQHDDFVWTAGPFMQPDIYRSVIIPRYAELWKSLKRAGKKVLFCSDGDFRQFAGDIIVAGADGLIFEPVMTFAEMVEKYGQTTVLIGSAVDCRELTFGTWDRVRAQVDESLELARRCRGVILATGNHLPANIPGTMLVRYRDYLQAHRDR